MCAYIYSLNEVMPHAVKLSFSPIPRHKLSDKVNTSTAKNGKPLFQLLFRKVQETPRQYRLLLLRWAFSQIKDMSLFIKTPHTLHTGLGREEQTFFNILRMPERIKKKLWTSAFIDVTFYIQESKQCHVLSSSLPSAKSCQHLPSFPHGNYP